MMIHLSDEENALCEKLRRAETQKEIDEIIAKLKEIRKKMAIRLKIYRLHKQLSSIT